MNKIALVSNSSFSMYFFRKGLISTLVSKGHQVHVIAPEDYKTEDLKKLGCVYHPLNFQTKSTNPLRDIFLFWKFLQLYKRIKPDIIFQYTIKPNIYGTIAARVNGIKSVAVITGLGYAFLTDNWINKVVRMMYKAALRFSSKVWFLNTDDQELFVGKGIVKKSVAFLLPGEGVNTTEFAPSPDRPDNRKRIFLMIARILWDKGVLEYVEAAKKIKALFPQTKFQLVGSTDVDNPSAVPKAVVEEWHQKGYIEYLGLSVDIRKEMAAAHCIVLPSYREGISKVLMEAASMAKPLIASDVVGCRELIDEGQNGYLCVVKNIDSLAEKMQSIILLNEQELENMGNKGRKKMLDHYDEKIIIEFYLSYITEIEKN